MTAQLLLTGDGHGRHIPGTPDDWKHGWIPLTETAARTHGHGTPPKGWRAPAARSGGARRYGTVVVASGIGDPVKRQAAIAEVQSGMDRMGRFVPGIASKIKVSLDDRTDPDSMGSSFPWGQIDLTPKATTAVGGAAHSRQVVDDAVRKQFFTQVNPAKVSLAQYAVAHETGHHVDYQLGFPVTENSEIWGPIADALGAPRPKVLRSGRASLEGWADDNQNLIAAGVSKYSTDDLPELKAELWAEYTLSDHPRPAAKLYGDYIVAHQGETS